ncbi:MAG TPA: hypothetical protein VIO38_04315, partial [Rariglobus sp.]
MNFNVNHKVGFLATAAGLALIALTATVHQKFTEIKARNLDVVTVFQGLQNHQTADMMHDALRSDVLSAMDAVRRGDTAGHAEVVTETAEHIGVFRQSQADNAALPLPPAVLAALTETRPQVESYLKAAERLVALAATDPAATTAALPDFRKTFGDLETALGNISDIFKTEAARINTSAADAVTRFQRTLLGSALASLLALAIIAVLVARNIPRPFAAIIGSLGNVSEANATSA